MTTLIDAQMAIVQARWPELHRHLLGLLQGPATPLPEVQQVQGRSSTLSVAGLQLSSRHDPAAEARTQAATLPDAEVVHLYGPALGELARHLLRSRPGLRQLAVHLLNPEVFLLVLHLSDQSDWLSDARVQLDRAAEHREVTYPFFAHPAELILAADASARIRDRLISENTLGFIRQTFRSDHPLLSRRLADNQALVRADRDVASLFGSNPGRPALVIGTGPTLEQHLPELLQISRQDPRPLLIAVDTALVPLAQAGIHPDIVVSIDYRTQARFLQSPQADRTALVYAPVLPTEVLQAWSGPRFCTYSPSSVYDAARKQTPRGMLFDGGSVIHPAIDLAVQMGARQISLYGTDFCFPGGKTHAHWPAGELNTDLDNARHWVLNGRGERVSTHPNFASYLVELERYIERHPQIRFIQSSADSARIAGCSLREETTP